jgi:hypothetical protein
MRRNVCVVEFINNYIPENRACGRLSWVSM